jgi:hypothetical protein
VLLAGVYLVAFLDRRPPLALVVTVLGFVAISFFAVARMTSAATGSTGELPRQLAWVDATGKRDIPLISGIGMRKVAALETAFNNNSISDVYYLCQPSFEADYGERSLTLGSRGRLLDGGGVVRARYAVVPTSFGIRGHVLARDPRGGLELTAPTDGVLRVPPRNRARVSCGP